MPRQIDLFPRNLQLGHNPLNQLGMSIDQLEGFLAALPEEILKAFIKAVWQLLDEIDKLTGLNLVAFADAIKQLLNVTEDVLTALLEQIPVIGPILEALTGTTPSLEEGKALFAFIQFLRDILAVLGPIIGLGTGKPVIGALEHIPILGPLIEAITIELGGVVDGVPGMRTVLQDVQNTVNNMISLIEGVGGTVINDVVHLILKIQQIIDTILNALGTPGSNNSLAQLGSSIQSSLSGLQSAFVNAFDGGATALNAIIFHNDGGAQASFSPNLTAPLSVIVHNLDGGATGLHDLIFNNDGGAIVSQIATAGSGLISAIDGGAMSLASAVQNNITAAVSTAQQITSGVESSIHNAFGGFVAGLFNAFSGGGAASTATVAQANSAASGVYSTTATNNQNIGGMTGLNVTTLNQALQKSAAGRGGGNSGTNVTLNFSSYANQSTMSGIFTPFTAALSNAGTGGGPIPTTYTSGGGTLVSQASEMGITGGVAAWQSSTAEARDYELYPTTTTTDYQVVSLNLASVSTNMSDFALFGRSNSTGGTCVIGFVSAGGYHVEIGCFVGGTYTSLDSVNLSSNVPAGALCELVLGNESTSNPYALSFVINGTTVLSFSDTSHISQYGSSYRYAGMGMDQFIGPGLTYTQYTPPAVSQWGLADNAPPAVIGSGFRAFRSTTTNTGLGTTGTVTLGGGTYTYYGLAASSFDTVQWITGDLTFTSSTNTLTVSIAGWYMVEVGLGITASATSNIGAGLLHNGSLYEAGDINVYTAGTNGAIKASFVIYCTANDTLRPAMVYISSGLGYSGDANGVACYFAASLMNCGTLS